MRSPFTGIDVPPFWKVRPPWLPWKGDGIHLVIEPGAGMGDGTHETTQLCLQAIAAVAPRDGRAWRMLDFGSGSGILAIAAAKLGATVEAIEIDGPAIENAEHNARLSSVDDRILFSRAIDGVSGALDVVVANVLRSVLLDFAEGLVARLAPAGTLVLSGLVPTDVPEVGFRYESLLGGRPPMVHRRGDWCALAWRP